MLRSLPISLLVLALGCGPGSADVHEASDEVGELDAALSSGVPLGSTLRATTNVKLHSGPSSSAGTYEVLPLGTTMVALSGIVSNSYFHVYADGRFGWAYGASLALVSTPAAGDGTCEQRFFSQRFDADNGSSYAATRDSAYARILDRYQELKAAGAHVSLGGVLALMMYEANGAKLSYFNDRCAENSYDQSSSCATDAQARYSYQYGLAPIHTSNFHPCADHSWTQRMREHLNSALATAGYAPSATDLAAVTPLLHAVCPAATATAADYYILRAHSVFLVPKNTTGNALDLGTGFPFFDARVTVSVFFDELEENSDSMHSDRDLIRLYGSSDAAYGTSSRQDAVLSLYGEFKATHCD